MWYKIYDNSIDFRGEILTNAIGIEASRKAVEHIIKFYKPPYNLMVSGGIDSQAMLYAWKMFGFKYRPTCVIYNNGLNDHDYSTLIKFAKKIDTTINFINFDLLNFYKTEYHQYALKYQCSSPQITAYLKMTEGLPGTVIYSGSLIGNGFIYNNVQHALTLESTNRSLIPFFLLYTPELAYSNVKIRKEIQCSDPYKYRVTSYHKLGFPVIPQEKKLSGFEKVKDYYDQEYSKLVDWKIKAKYAHKSSHRTYDLILRYPYEDIIPPVHYDILLNP